MRSQRLPLSRRRVLAISPDLQRLRRLVPILERAGAEVDAVLDHRSIEGDTLPHRCIFFAWDGDMGALQSMLPRVRAKAHVAIVVPKAPLKSLTDFLADPRCNHVICGAQGEGKEGENERDVYVTAHKLLSGDIFGIEKYLPENTPVNYFRLR